MKVYLFSSEVSLTVPPKRSEAKYVRLRGNNFNRSRFFQLYRYLRNSAFEGQTFTLTGVESIEAFLLDTDEMYHGTISTRDKHKVTYHVNY